MNDVLKKLPNDELDDGSNDEPDDESADESDEESDDKSVEASDETDDETGDESDSELSDASRDEFGDRREAFGDAMSDKSSAVSPVPADHLAVISKVWTKTILKSFPLFVTSTFSARLGARSLSRSLPSKLLSGHLSLDGLVDGCPWCSVALS